MHCAVLLDVVHIIFSETVQCPLAQAHFTVKVNRATRKVKTTLHNNFEKLKNTATHLFKTEKEQPLDHRDCDCFVLVTTIITECTVPKCSNFPHTTINT